MLRAAPTCVSAADHAVRKAFEKQARAILAAGRKAVNKGDVPEMVRQDEAFHRLFYETSGNPLLAQTAEPHWRFLRRVMGDVLRHAEPPHDIWDQHEAIVEAVLEGRCSAAANLMARTCHPCRPLACQQLPRNRRNRTAMIITEPLNIGQVLTAQARLQPDRTGCRDLTRAMTFRQWNQRACRAANALTGLGLAKGDRVAILAYNRIEWAEIFVAAAKAGIIAVPINFRLTGAEVAVHH